VKHAAIIFDLFGTLVESPSLAEREVVLRKMVSILGTPYADFEREWSRTARGRDMGVFRDFRSNLEFICQKISARPDNVKKEAAEKIRMAYIKDLLVPRTETIAVLRMLKKSGRKIGLISDCSVEVPGLWDNTEVSHFFDAAVFSCLVGIKKPDAAIYRIAAERLAVSPGQCLYVGDGGSRELTGASQAGMEAIMMSANRSNPDAQVLDRDQWDGPSVSSLIGLVDYVR
jgi:putative hydrolase of the HAD superfamily